MSEYRCDLMVEVSREYILKPAKAVNPNVKVIIKFPFGMTISTGGDTMFCVKQPSSI
jgi:hypothetical protein